MKNTMKFQKLQASSFKRYS